MCGIAGIWGPSDTGLVRDMLDSLRHRGPDADGIHRGDAGLGTLGHTRLSIMDPEGGDQPIYSEDRRTAIVANGEIYNFPGLRPGLSTGHTFSTTSDSEAIVHLFEDHGVDLVRHLEGMYAFAVTDGRALVMARDPIGIKPLYLGRRNGTLVFASELKALAPVCDTVEEFPPGAVFHSDRGLSTYYEVPDLAVEDRDLEHFIREIRETLEAAVVKRLMSDVPVGAFLSGGLDSSLICAIARRHLGRLHTFSVGVEGSPDLEAARFLSRYLDTIHHEYVLTAREVRDRLPEILYSLESFDQDLVRSAFPCYFTSKIAADHVKVILTGEGADELFAGYTYYKGIPDDGILHRELRRSVASLHNINLQRVDRMTMAHSIEGRVPFLDLAMIELGQRIPARYKIAGNPLVEKWILRKAFEDLLPEEILWRKKEQFDEGSGSAALLPEVLADLMSDAEAAEHARRHADTFLRSPEECFYHSRFLDAYENPGPVLTNVARWAVRPPEVAGHAR